MNAIVEAALDLWGYGGADYALVAERENRVFRISMGGRTRALRLHRPGYRTDRELWSELQWMEAVAEGGLTVPAPIPSLDGPLLQVVDDTQVDVLTWLSGTPVALTIDRLGADDRIALLCTLGREMAGLHVASDAWQPPAGFVRGAWDRKGLLGESPLWDRFWENPGLSGTDRELLLLLRNVAAKDLGDREENLNFGLIHADLVPENVLVHGTNMSLIDFDDGGFGFRLFDLATALVKLHDKPDFEALKLALVEGYQSIRGIDLSALDLFLALRAATYVGWNITRMDEAGGGARNGRFITTARDLTRGYLTARA